MIYKEQFGKYLQKLDFNLILIKIMLEKIKDAVFAKYKKEDSKGLFLSVFEDKNILLLSNGVFYTDKSLDEIIDTLYKGLVERHKNVSTIVADIVVEHSEIDLSKELNTISLVEYGIMLLGDDKTGVLLPNTKGITNIQDALKLIKEKNGLSGNVKVVKFKTDRFTIN